MQFSNRKYQSVIKKSRNIVWSLIRFVLLTGLVFIILSPLIFYTSNALKSYADMYDVTVTYIPRSPSFDNFRMLSRYIHYPVTLLKTFGFTVLIAALQTLSCLLVGYGLARFAFKGNSLMFALVMVTLVIPPQIMLVPVYIRFRSFNLLQIFKFSGTLSGISLINTPWPILLLAVTALAGPGCNLLITVVFLFLYGLLLRPLSGSAVGKTLLELLELTAYISIGFCIFNLIPVPPLDGSKILFSVLPDSAYWKLMRYERYGSIALIVLVWTGVLGRPLSRLIRGAYGLLFPIAEAAFHLMNG